MRFEELAYSVDGLQATVRFRAGLTVVCLPEDERAEWVARLLGVLEGTRAGDSTSAIYVDGRGRRIKLDRDEQGAATLIDLATGDDVPYSARHLPLDGRFDWFASVGLTSRAASDLILFDSGAFTADEEYDPWELEAKRKAAQARLTRLGKQHQSALTRSSRSDDLRGRIAQLDEQLGMEAEAVPAAAAAAEDWWRAMGTVDDARRAFGSRVRLDGESLTRALARPTEGADHLEVLAKACRAMAERRDELVARLDAGAAAEVDRTAAGTRRELIEEVEPAYVDALSALADGCRPFGVTIDAARIEAAGLGASGMDGLGAAVLAEVAAQTEEARGARLQQALEDAEADCPATRECLEHHLAALGLPTAGTPDLAAGAEALAARVDMLAERTQLAQEILRVERNLPDVAELAGRNSALEEEVAALVASLSAGRPLVSTREAETILLGRAAEAGRNDRRREPLPLVVNDAFAPFGTGDKRQLLDAIALLHDTTQIVYLTDDPDTLAWATQEGVDGGAGSHA